MSKSFLKGIVSEMKNDTTRREFIDKIHDETGIDKASLEEAYDTGSIPAESKANVFSLLERKKWAVNPDVKDSRQTRQNPVAKHARTYSNSGGVHAGKDKTYSRKRKHRNMLDAALNPSNSPERIEGRRGNVKARELAKNLKDAGKTFQYAYKRANELKGEGKMDSARIWAKAAFRMTRDAHKRRNVPEEIGKVPANLSTISKLRNMARHNEFEIFRGGEGQIIFSKNNFAYMWDETTGKLHRRQKRQWNEVGSFGPDTPAEEVWQAIESDMDMSDRPMAVGEAKEHRVYDYRKKQYVGKNMSQRGAYNSANKRNQEYGADSFHVHDKAGKRVLSKG